ncbi:hypothetical protein K7X08_024373 [Anisodus acutangulus]|uniref:C2H2-type domain-containing protein n=1 Tax=Anisodus acutangulus TaxID=402998 RepID=A0A9Q1M7P2_9SOLA|nr:hypothetical protein K7X08_024373 [Anisodus acutangulus]
MAEDKGVENANAIQRELQYKQKIANLFPDYVLPLKEVKRQKALISKNKKSAGRIIDCSATTCKDTGVSQDTLKHLESDGKSTIIKRNSSVNNEIPSSAPNASLLPNDFPSMTLPPRPLLSPTFTYSRRKKNADSSNSGFVSPRQQHKPNIMHYCKDCGVHCSGALCYELHLRGEKHKVKLQCSRDPSNKERNKRVRCDLCEIYCQDETLLEMHLKGKKHKAKEHVLEHGEKIKNENGQQFWCELCQIPCMNEETFTLHCNGKKHRKHLYVFEEEKKKTEAMDSAMPSSECI